MPACEHCHNCPCCHFPQMAKPITVEHKDIMVIGESVSVMEARKGHCMTGMSSDILKQTMTKVGLPISEDKVHYTVAVMCAVPKRKGKPFPKDPMIQCQARLIEEINLVKPKVIIVLGKVALQTLTGNFSLKITEYYGRTYTFHDLGLDKWNKDSECQIVPCMHPNLIIHAPKDYKPFIAELQLVSTIYDGGSAVDTGTTEWQVLNTEALCDQAVQFLKQFPLVGADIETTGLDYRTAEYCVMGMCFYKNKVLVLPREMRHRVKDFLALPNLKWIWHNGKYDRKVLWRRRLTMFDELGWHIFPHQHDTEYMHYVLDETSAHDLGYLTKTFLHAAEYKYKMNQQFKNVTLETYPQYFDALCERVAVDADYTFQLAKVLWDKINQPENASLRKVYDTILMPAANFLARVEQNGMLVNEDILNDLNAAYEIKLEQILQDIQREAEPFWDKNLYMEQTGAKTAGDTFKPGSPKQMAWMVFDRLKLKPRRKKGRSTGAEVLESIEEDIPLIDKVLEYRGVAKEKSTYVVGTLKLRDVDGRVRSNFNLHVTATGRLSSKEPNVQNLPSANGVGNVRRAYIPPKGKILMEVDYSSAELRWLAFLSHDKVLTDIFKSGRNLHKETATRLFGPNYTLQQKMRAKAVNFGIPYGREEKSFQDEFQISYDEAHQLIQGWLNAYPEARDYLQWCADQIPKGKYLETPWGNRRRVGLVTQATLHNLENEFKNFPIQGSSSHTLLYSAMKVEQYIAKEFDARIIDLIHDSMLIEVPMDKETVQATSLYVAGEMIKTPVDLFDCPVPFKCDTDLGPDWGSVEGYNNKTGNMEIEHKDCEKPWVEILPYEEWINKVYHFDVYERPWYKQLQTF